MSDNITQTCDVAIAGGGPAGATVARILAGWGFAVTVIAGHSSRKAGEVMGPEANPVLDALELTSLLATSAGIAAQCDGVVAHWPSMGPDLADHGLRGVCGWAIDPPRLVAALKRLALINGCRWLEEAVLASVTRNTSGYVLSLASGGQTQVVTAKFVIDATGRASRLARRLGARRIVDDKLIAAAARLKRHAPQRDPYLHLTATPHGWWYRTDGPADDTRVAMVADPLDSVGRPDALKRVLRRLLEELYPGLAATATSKMFVMDASSARLNCCAADSWLAVGDAATAFDPLCGQGLAQAFGSALAAAHATRECMAGNPHALAAYDHAVQATYRHSRAQLDLRYAYRGHCEPNPFWLARAHQARSLNTSGL
ncbi:NAD(P)/FAD-dependent oxidoreductase [Mycetohabitans endofungorum]|uniref:NAD(P)/FAD-dependent oxidoreductase n=1 Tax=Mycetohabitans endofungorum TaxID=417203 RepID=UPI002B056942|nr:tryptophan 7-halogenase [Mycetohabitans endofungorum]